MSIVPERPRVLLIDPPDFKGAMTRTLQLPLGLIALANYLSMRETIRCIQLIDLTLSYLRQPTKRGVSPVQLLQSSGVLSSQWDIIGITTHFTNTLASLSIAKYLKFRYPDAVIVFGGVHATSCSSSILKTFPFIDAVTVGEGELALNRLCELWSSSSSHRIDFSSVPNIAFRSRDGEIVKTNADYLS